MSTADVASIVAVPPRHTELAATFRTWAGDEADLRVFFIPDVLIGLDTPTRRGYLYDDGWTLEVWIERGVPEFLDLLSAEYLSDQCKVERPPGDPSPQRSLLELVLSKGAPIDEVRHLL